MVNHSILGISARWLVGQVPAIERIDPARNAILLILLLGLVLLSIILIACVMVGGRWVRRLARPHISQSNSPHASDKENWRQDLANQLPDTKLQETIVIDQITDETIID